MSAKQKQRNEDEIVEATSKLGRLLETENELDAMLKAARRSGKELVEAAEREASDRAERFEAQLKEESRQLRERFVSDRDETLDSIQREAQQEAKRLDELEEAKIEALARHVIDLIVVRTDSRGSS